MVNIFIQISIFFMFISVIWSSPKCRYVQINEEYYPIGFCNAIYDPTTSLLKSFVFSCNTTNTVLMTESIGTQYCSGGNTQVTDITQQIVDFNCRLPLCNTVSDPLLLIEESQPCDPCGTEFGQGPCHQSRKNLIVNQCIDFDDTNSDYYSMYSSCGNNPFSYSRTYYDETSDCSGNIYCGKLLINGCNTVGSTQIKINILQCAQPSSPGPSLPECPDPTTDAIVYDKQKSETKQTINGNTLYIVMGTLVIFILLLFILFCIWIKRIVREPSKLKIETENEWQNQSEHDDELELVTTTR